MRAVSATALRLSMTPCRESLRCLRLSLAARAAESAWDSTAPRESAAAVSSAPEESVRILVAGLAEAGALPESASVPTVSLTAAGNHL